jgi:ribose 5-phosphate isomerase B
MCRLPDNGAMLVWIGRLPVRLAIASDHAGFALKTDLIPYLRSGGHEVIDLGVASDTTRSDYPDVAQTLADALRDGRAERGILICGSGVGASIAANKVPGIYAAMCHDTYSAAQGVEHDNMNVLCLGGRIIGAALAEKLVDAFTGAAFNTREPRYQARFDKVLAMERARDRT